jgi:hypothetical protein
MRTILDYRWFSKMVRMKRRWFESSPGLSFFGGSYLYETNKDYVDLYRLSSSLSHKDTIGSAGVPHAKHDMCRSFVLWIFCYMPG